MKASPKSLAWVVLFLGLAATAFAHSALDVGSMDGILPAVLHPTPGFPNAVSFSGTFAGPVSWTLIALSNGINNFALAGVLTGVMGGAPISAITTELTANLQREPEGSTAISIGDTTREESVPEPSAVALLGTGLVTLLGVNRRRSGRSPQLK